MRRPGKAVSAVLLAAAGCLVVLFAAGWLYVSSKASPEKLREQLEMALARVFPQAVIMVGELDYRVGLGLDLGVRAADVSASLPDGPVFRLGALRASVPVRSLLAGGGTVVVSLEEPLLRHHARGDSSNWSRAMDGGLLDGAGAGDDGDDGDGDDDGADDPGAAAALPALLAGSRLDVSVEGLELDVSIDGRETRATIDRLLLRDVGVDSATSFELDSDVAARPPGGRGLAFGLRIRGEARPGEWLGGGDLPVRAEVGVDGLTLEGTPVRDADVESEIELAVGRDGRLRGSVRASQGEARTLEADFEAHALGAEVEDARIGIGGGSARLALSVSVGGERMTTSFRGSVEDVDAASFQGLLPKEAGTVGGTFRGTFRGTSRHAGAANGYDVSLDLEGADGVLERMDLTGALESVLSRLPSRLAERLGGRTVTLSPGFRRLRARGRFRETLHSLRELSFEGLSGGVAVRGRGEVRPGGGPGEILLEVTGGGALGDLLREARADSLPLRFAGDGLALRPDHAHTARVLGRNYLRTEGRRRAREAAREAVRDKAGELLDEAAKDKAGELLKGGARKLLEGLF